MSEAVACRPIIYHSNDPVKFNYRTYREGVTIARGVLDVKELTDSFLEALTYGDGYERRGEDGNAIYSSMTVFGDGWNQMIEVPYYIKREEGEYILRILGSDPKKVRSVAFRVNMRLR